MKSIKGILMAMGLLVVSVEAGTFPSSITRDPLARGDMSERLSVGVTYTYTDREISVSRGADMVLKADRFSGYVGYDALPWLTTFVTLGGTRLDTSDAPWTSSDYEFSYSVGVNAYLWEADVLEPAFAAGRLTVKAHAEVGQNQSSSNLGDSDWMELTIAIPVGYELFDRYAISDSGVSTSLALYAGPAFSMLDGDIAVGGRVAGFESDREFGALVGADVYFAPSVSVGASALIMNEASFSVSGRFHF